MVNVEELERKLKEKVAREGQEGIMAGERVRAAATILEDIRRKVKMVEMLLL